MIINNYPVVFMDGELGYFDDEIGHQVTLNYEDYNYNRMAFNRWEKDLEFDIDNAILEKISIVELRLKSEYESSLAEYEDRLAKLEELVDVLNDYDD